LTEVFAGPGFFDSEEDFVDPLDPEAPTFDVLANCLPAEKLEKIE
jgi:hypothetical protein